MRSSPQYGHYNNSRMRVATPSPSSHPHYQQQQYQYNSIPSTAAATNHAMMHQQRQQHQMSDQMLSSPGQNHGSFGIISSRVNSNSTSPRNQTTATSVNSHHLSTTTTAAANYSHMMTRRHHENHHHHQATNNGSTVTVASKSPQFGRQQQRSRDDYQRQQHQNQELSYHHSVNDANEQQYNSRTPPRQQQQQLPTITTSVGHVSPSSHTTNPSYNISQYPSTPTKSHYNDNHSHTPQPESSASWNYSSNRSHSRSPGLPQQETTTVSNGHQQAHQAPPIFYLPDPYSHVGASLSQDSTHIHLHMSFSLEHSPSYNQLYHYESLLTPELISYVTRNYPGYEKLLGKYLQRALRGELPLELYGVFMNQALAHSSSDQQQFIMNYESIDREILSHQQHELVEWTLDNISEKILGNASQHYNNRTPNRNRRGRTPNIRSSAAAMGHSPISFSPAGHSNSNRQYDNDNDAQIRVPTVLLLKIAYEPEEDLEFTKEFYVLLRHVIQEQQQEERSSIQQHSSLQQDSDTRPHSSSQPSDPSLLNQQKQLQQAQQQLEQSSQQHTNQITLLENELQTCHDRIQELNSLYQSSTSTNDKLEKELQEVRRQFYNERSRVDSLEERLNSMKREMDRLISQQDQSMIQTNHLRNTMSALQSNSHQMSRNNSSSPHNSNAAGVTTEEQAVGSSHHPNVTVRNRDVLTSSTHNTPSSRNSFSPSNDEHRSAPYSAPQIRRSNHDPTPSPRQLAFNLNSSDRPQKYEPDMRNTSNQSNIESQRDNSVEKEKSAESMTRFSQPNEGGSRGLTVSSSENDASTSVASRLQQPAKKEMNTVGVQSPRRIHRPFDFSNRTVSVPKAVNTESNVRKQQLSLDNGDVDSDHVSNSPISESLSPQEEPNYERVESNIFLEEDEEQLVAEREKPHRFAPKTSDAVADDVGLPFSMVDICSRFSLRNHDHSIMYAVAQQPTETGRWGSCICAESSWERGIHQWEVRIDSLPDTETRNIMIGVINLKDSNEFDVEEDFCGQTLSSYSVHFMRLDCYNDNIHTSPFAEEQFIAIKEGSIVKFTLDLERRTLSLSIDGDSLGVAFNSLPAGEYTPCVSLKRYQQMVSHISYNQLL